jgi:hypothetical protein
MRTAAPTGPRKAGPPAIAARIAGSPGPNKWDNHRAALGVFFMHYNYCRKHSSLKGHTPAMAHGLATEVWSVRKMLETVTA